MNCHTENACLNRLCQCTLLLIFHCQKGSSPSTFLGACQNSSRNMTFLQEKYISQFLFRLDVSKKPPNFFYFYLFIFHRTLFKFGLQIENHCPTVSLKLFLVQWWTHNMEICINSRFVYNIIDSNNKNKNNLLKINQKQISFVISSCSLGLETFLPIIWNQVKQYLWKRYL